MNDGNVGIKIVKVVLFCVVMLVLGIMNDHHSSDSKATCSYCGRTVSGVCYTVSNDGYKTMCSTCY